MFVVLAVNFLKICFRGVRGFVLSRSGGITQ